MAYGTIKVDTIISTSGTVDLTAITTDDATTSASGYMSAADKTKLDGIEASATADQTGAEIKTAYEAEADTNAFTDAEKTKLSGIATGAEVNVDTDLSYTASTRVLASSTGTNATLPEVVASGDSGLMTGADKAKLDGVAAGAEANTVTSVNTATGAVVLDADDIDDASTTNKFVTAADVTALGTLSSDLAGKADLSGGKLDTSQLPDIAISEYKGAVADQTAMLAVSGEKGDWVVRNDDGKVYVITGTDPSVVGGWTALSYPTAPGTDLSYTASTRALASSTGTNVTLPEVVAAGDSGLMTGADKTKLDGIATGAQVNVATDLTYTASTRELASSTGTNATLPEVVAAGDSGLMTGSDKTKLDGIATGAEVNVVYTDNTALQLGSSNDTSLVFDGTDTDIRLTGGDLKIEDGTTLRFTFARTTGDFTATGNVTAYSDINLKENIEIIPNALDKVSAIRGVTYDRKDVDVERQAGVIAQEVEAVLPEVVMTDEEGVKSVAYGNLVGLLIEAVKELKAEVETLKQERN